MLHKKQLKCIEMLATGDWKKTEIARELDISRQAIYDWLDNGEFKAALDKRLQDIKTQAQRDFTSKLPEALRLYWNIAKTGSSREKESALKYWIDRSLGRIANSLTVDDKREDNSDIDILAAFEAAVGDEDGAESEE